MSGICWLQEIEWNANSKCLKHNKGIFLKSVVIHPRMDQLEVQVDSGFQMNSLGTCFCILLPSFPIGLFPRQAGSQCGRKRSTKNTYFWILIKRKKDCHNKIPYIKSDQILWLTYIRSYTHLVIMVGIKREYFDWPAVIVASLCGHRQVHPTQLQEMGFPKESGILLLAWTYWKNTAK